MWSISQQECQQWAGQCPVWSSRNVIAGNSCRARGHKCPAHCELRANGEASWPPFHCAHWEGDAVLPRKRKPAIPGSRTEVILWSAPSCLAPGTESGLDQVLSLQAQKITSTIALVGMVGRHVVNRPRQNSLNLSHLDPNSCLPGSPQKAQTVPESHSGLHALATIMSSWQCLYNTVLSDPYYQHQSKHNKRKGIHTVFLRFMNAGMPFLFLWTWNPGHSHHLPALLGTSMVFDDSYLSSYLKGIRDLTQKIQYTQYRLWAKEYTLPQPKVQKYTENFQGQH